MRMRHKKNLSARWEQTAARSIADPSSYKGRWKAALKPDASGLFVELGCGRGSFVCALAARERDALIVAAERVRDAMIVGMERAEREAIPNLRFVAGDAAHLGDWFAEGELDGLYIHFCDPWPSRGHAKRRLVAGGFLELYRPLLAPGAFLRFKTDNAALFAFGCDELRANKWQITEEIHDLPRSDDNIETEYEQKFRALGVPIHALRASPPR